MSAQYKLHYREVLPSTDCVLAVLYVVALFSVSCVQQMVGANMVGACGELRHSLSGLTAGNYWLPRQSPECLLMFAGVFSFVASIADVFIYLKIVKVVAGVLNPSQ